MRDLGKEVVMGAVLTVGVPAALEPAQRSELVARLRPMLGGIPCRVEVRCDPYSWRVEVEGFGAPRLERPAFLARIAIEVRKYLRELGVHPACRGDPRDLPEPESAYLLLLSGRGRFSPRYAEYSLPTKTLHVYRPLSPGEEARLRAALTESHNRGLALRTVEELGARRYDESPPARRELEGILAEVYAVVGEHPEVVVWGDELMTLGGEYLSDGAY